MGSKRNWWLTAAVTVVLTVIVGILGYITILMLAFWFVFDGDDLGPRPIDEQSAARAMDRRGISIPDGFEFAEMTELAQFVGANSYWGRYTAPGTFAEAHRALALANQDYPPLRPVACTAAIVNGFVNKTGFRCDSATEMVVSTRVPGSASVSATHSYTPSDSESLLLVGNGAQVDLFVVSEGH